MNQPYILRCRVCHQVIDNPYISFDRRTQRHSTDIWQGKPRPAIKILQAQEMFRYDSQDCRSLQEPHIFAELQLKTTYPSGSGDVVPCSRCGATVDRNLLHVRYSFLEAEMANCPMTNVIDDTELAVLCNACEEPDQPATQAAVATAQKRERSRA
ncbi:MAG: hypothetical protein IPQ22_13980 [Rhodoferax sp.]|nr:hypothetical protein [Rhodoferax sp.]